MMVGLAERIRNGQTNQKGLFDSVVGQIKTQEKRWIVDIDTKDRTEMLAITDFINHECRPDDFNKVKTVIPTKNGYHLITERFDVMEFAKQFPKVDIQKKNPTLLYLPESLND